VLLTGCALFVLGGLWFVAGVDHAPDFWGEWLPRSILTGAAVGLLLPSLSGAAVASLARPDFALGSAINQATRQFGSVLGVATAVVLLGEQAAHGTPAAFVQSYGLMTAGGVLTALLCLPLSKPSAAPATYAAVPSAAGPG
jgi:hypothetical protein